MEINLDIDMPLWGIVGMLVAAYLLIGVLVGRMVFRASRKWHAENRGGGGFVSVLCLALWPLLLLISLLFWHNEE